MKTVKPTTPRERAKHRVKRIRKFHRHLFVFVLVMLGLLISRSELIDFLQAKGMEDPYQLKWINANIVINFLIWVIILGIHAFVVFVRPGKWFRHWEEREIQKILDKERKDQSDF